MKLEELDFADIERFYMYIGVLDNEDPWDPDIMHTHISDAEDVEQDVDDHADLRTNAIDYKNVSERTKQVLDKAKERFEKDTGIKFTWY